MSRKLPQVKGREMTANHSHGKEKLERISRREKMSVDASSPPEYSSQVLKASEKLGRDEFSRKVAEMVRYFILNDKRKIPIKRQDIHKNVMKEHVKAFPKVFEAAKVQLAKVFGIDVIEAETSNKSKLYLLVSKSDDGEYDLGLRSWDRNVTNASLLMALLSLIYMNEDFLSEVMLWKFMKQLGLHKEKYHKDFGDIDKLVQDLVRQMYIAKEKVAGCEGSTIFYRWGVRSRIETTKWKVLMFVSEMYGVNIESWRVQYNEIVDKDRT